MNRLLIALLAAVDALIAAAVGIAAALAPLTLLWVLGMGGTADWGTLWPASAAVWQLGNLVPLQISLPGDYLAVVGIDPEAASFVLSLAPLAFAAFTAIFAARSGVRASRAESWGTGVVAGAAVFAALATAIALTSATDVAQVQLWQAIVLPTAVYALALLAGAVATEWREAGAGAIARLRDRVEAAPHGWGDALGLTVRGTAVVLVGLIGLGALVFAVAVLLGGGEVIALFEAAHVDALGASVVTLAQLAYLPTVAIWGMSFVAGPGFAVGAGTAVSPAGTQLGVIPGIPVLGALPESTTPWMLLLALLPIGLGALAGWIARSALAAGPLAAAAPGPHVLPEWDAAPAAARGSALTALLAGAPGAGGQVAAEPARTADDLGSAAEDPIGARLTIAVGIAVLSGAGAALLSALASGSIGPGRLSQVGPEPGPVALAVGAEVLLGAAILLLSPRRRRVGPAAAATPLADGETETALRAEAPFGARPETEFAAAGGVGLPPSWAPSEPWPADPPLDRVSSASYAESPFDRVWSASPEAPHADAMPPTGAADAAAAHADPTPFTGAADADPAGTAAADAASAAAAPAEPARSAPEAAPPATAAAEEADSTPTVDLGPRRPTPLPPID